MIAALLPLLAQIGGQVAKSLFPDPEDAQKRDEAEQRFQVELIKQASVIEEAAASIVRSEAQSEHWLAANWRPVTMLVFVALIVARWFGWAAPNLGEDEYLKLWDIVQLGLGGYVIGRSAEKIVPAIADAMSRRRE